MIVKAAPRFATILCRWLGKLAMPIGDADSIVAGAIVTVVFALSRVHSVQRIECLMQSYMKR